MKKLDSKLTTKDMPEKIYVGLSRYVCDVLSEMRKCVKTLNFGGLMGLIEEAQSMVNRMESALERHKTLVDLEDNIAELEAFRDKLHIEIEKEVEDHGSV